jgi:hypothetical protein
LIRSFCSPVSEIKPSGQFQKQTQFDTKTNQGAANVIAPAIIYDVFVVSATANMSAVLPKKRLRDCADRSQLT